MSYSKTESTVLGIAQSVANAQGYDVYDVEYVKEGPHWFLRIFITGGDGVSLDDCEIISRAVGDVLDRDDVVKENYFLEVSSPGIERALRQDFHFDGAIGENIRVMLKNGKTVEGVLMAHDADNITVDDNPIGKQNIKKANILFDFE